MGSGVTTASINFRPEKNGPDLDLYLKIEDTQLTAMNDLLRAYGNFDVSAGAFSLVRNAYKKRPDFRLPQTFFQDMKVYDRRKIRSEASCIKCTKC